MPDTIIVEKACGKGCDYCCQSAGATLFSLSEGRAIMEHCNKNGLAYLLEDCLEQYETTKNFTSGLDFVQYEKACPFLVDHSCAVYEVWPQVCRTWISPSVEMCKTYGTELPPSWEWLAEFNNANLNPAIAPHLRSSEPACADIRTVVIAAIKEVSPPHPGWMLIDNFSYGEWMDNRRKGYNTYRLEDVIDAS